MDNGPYRYRLPEYIVSPTPNDRYGHIVAISPLDLHGNCAPKGRSFLHLKLEQSGKMVAALLDDCVRV